MYKIEKMEKIVEIGLIIAVSFILLSFLAIVTGLILGILQLAITFVLVSFFTGASFAIGSLLVMLYADYIN